ncbi:MAG: hypothetical protein KBD35_05035 [Moraxellaceae bacterium]|jgi:hypothetical protein|nr:hypothetical protein [Moraxellaceae bacterium]MBP7230244.1 hypothetical protein [Moraxellaceae bacterium]MBP9730752.1 hypothetical protein [Moraxellaceae bacterium]HQV41562.1 hypothetical protein [Moraxellaceae bacterium]HQX90273.1 hypothetical protein [Moraxellaceae bacterium]
MAYAMAWIVYLLMAALIMVAFERYLSEYLSHQPRLFIRALLAVGLFTPGVVSAETVYMVPACIAILFNVLIKSGLGVVKASLPILVVASVVFGVLLFRESRRQAAANYSENNS